MPTTYNFTGQRLDSETGLLYYNFRTGQRLDSETGLLYYNFRYYDPVSGRFVRADTVQGNATGMDPYAYVGDSPETHNDLSGHDNDPYLPYVFAWYAWIHPTDTVYMNYAIANSALPDDPNAWPYEKDWNQWPALYRTGTPGTGYADIVNTTQKLVWEVKTGGGLSSMGSNWPSPYSTVPRGVAQAGWYVARLNVQSRKTVFNVGSMTNDSEVATALKLCGGTCEIEYSDGTTLWIQSPALGLLSYRLNPADPTGPKTVPVVVGIKAKSGADVYLLILGLLYALLPRPTSPGGGGYPPAFASGGGGCSFRPDTIVWTMQGGVPIGQLVVGDTVFAYNAQMHVIELEQVLHVWIQTDADLFDVTIVIVDHHQTKVEIVHSTSRHPFLTQERGFIPVSQLQVGMHVLRANSNAGVITSIQRVPGSMVMYNLEVANDHTFVVGAGQWIVHNKCGEEWPME